MAESPSLMTALCGRRREFAQALVCSAGSRVGQLHLRLHADGPRDVPAANLVGQVAQQRALAHARLAPQDGDPAPAGERVGQQPVKRLTLAPASEEFRERPGILTRRRPPCILQRPLVAGTSRAYICGRGFGTRRPRGRPGVSPGERRSGGSARVIPAPPARRDLAGWHGADIIAEQAGRNCWRERRRRLEEPRPPRSTLRPCTASGTSSGRPSW